MKACTHTPHTHTYFYNLYLDFLFIGRQVPFQVFCKTNKLFSVAEPHLLGFIVKSNEHVLLGNSSNAVAFPSVY